ncbi:patatin-like phospholipase family protein [Labrys wisconsinensis]|uniref:Acylesterase/phospholipase RssA n=1 Tax=Labrys wisconsinensis TaxID=425677 RepID=A0ABU0J7Z1_9HYPH|nr:patatin-like phospholipase family protein [Labrys wisconsinensis]MDQ0470396.1 putative acylesterase/phospholipase RssA [Labrys wisconsinensis]
MLRVRSAIGALGRSVIPCLAVLALLQACVSTPRLAYTEDEAKLAVIEGFSGIRIWADAPSDAFIRSSLRPVPQPGKPFTYLALSGGGGEGAYGAGILAGWTAAGTRPEFTIVSGVSTGALIAPFAFLGSRYDGILKELYTSGIASTFVEGPNPVRAVFGPALFSRAPLREAVSRYATPELLAAIAAEHAKGRRLLVVTTNLDSDRAMIWDMGAIAATPSPRALGLFQDVITASASIPVVFPPMLIDAVAGGHHFQEMHVDGTVTTPVFTFPDNFLLRPDSAPRLTGPRPQLFILMNNRIDPTFHVIEDVAPYVAMRSFSTKNKQDARGILSATYELAQRNHLSFNLTYIDKSTPETSGTGFDTDYMRALYAHGYAKGTAGDFWIHAPPTAAGTPVAMR